MMLSAVCLLSLTVMTPAVPVPVETPKVEAPTMAPPAMAGAKLGKDGTTLEVVRPVSVNKAVPQAFKVPVTVTVMTENGPVTQTRIVEEMRYVTVTETVMQSSSYPLKDTGFQDLKGKKLTAEDAKKKLGNGLTPVLILQERPGEKDGAKLDPFYAQALKEGTLVLVLPAPQAPKTTPPSKGPLTPLPPPPPPPLPLPPPPKQ